MTAAPLSSPSPAPKFTRGPIMRHVAVMTATGSIGLMAIFVVDFLNLFYIAMLGEQELAAAIGYAGTVLFFTVSLCIGVTIAGTALVSRALGARAARGSPAARHLFARLHGGDHDRAQPRSPCRCSRRADAVRRDGSHARDRVALPADGVADDAADGARHGVLGRAACGRRRAACHVCDAVGRAVHRRVRSAADLRARARRRRRGDHLGARAHAARAGRPARLHPRA